MTPQPENAVAVPAPRPPRTVDGLTARVRRNPVHAALLVLAAVFFALHFLHLNADFPNHSPWVDWSKYTDEGWYGDAAIRHYLTGHWYWKGDFNPAVALPLWPLLELILFRFTGVSAAAARAFTLGVFAVTLVALYRLIARHTHRRTDHSRRPLAAPLAVFLLCCSPFLYVFERMAILEPLLIALTVLAVLAASHLHAHPLRERSLRLALPTVALALLLPAMVLAKTTAVFLFPAVFYMVWARAGYRMRPALRLALPTAVVGTALWCAYFFLLVRPHYMEDYQYLFSANAYTGFELEPLYSVVINTITDGAWMGIVLYLSFFAALALLFFWRPRLLTSPLIPTMLLWTGGYFFFLAYHNNLQPRYYLVVAVPITVFVALAIDGLRANVNRRAARISSAIATLVVLGIAVPDAVQQIRYVAHPTFDFHNAAQQIKEIVLEDHTHSHLILSISGSDLTLMTGLPSIDDDFGTMELSDRVQLYHPGWYVTWNDVDDDKADALTPLYHLERIADYPVMDDPDRNLLILYRLDPTAPEESAPAPHAHHRRTPKPLVTKLGQQPSTNQLQH
jgi:hypothetical protein